MKSLLATLAICLSVNAAAAAPALPKMTLEKFDRQAEPIVDQATAETARAVSQLQLPAGLEASLWAAEPMLANPVAFAFDEQGRLFVSETHRYRTSVLDIRGYMGMIENDLAARTVEDRAKLIEDLFGEQAKDFAIESELVRLVEDRDGDGKADFSSVYATGFNSTLDGIASGVLAREGEVYFTNIPHLWKLDGLTEDGKSTSRESLLHGFGVHFGYTGHDFHGLIIGPDGKLYFSIGDRGASVATKEGTRLEYPDTGAVYRSDLDGSNLEIVHWGLRNPQELAFDELGNLLTGDNDCDNGDFERLVHVVEGGDSGWRIGHQFAPLGGAGVWMSEGWWKIRSENQAKFLLPPVSYIEDGPSGIAYYPGTGLSPEYAGHLFVTHFKGSIATSGVHTYTLNPKGASFELKEKKQFLAGILPTDVTFAPDGKFYVLDWVDGWPKSNKGRVYAISHPETQQSPIVAQTQTLIAEGMGQRPSDELVSLLSHPNWNVRLEAQLELAERGPKSLKPLADLARDPKANLYARLHATWGLGQLAGKGSQPAKKEILARLTDPTDEVRAQAAKLAGDHKVAAAYKPLVAALRDSSARVQFFAAQSLGKLGNPAAGPALLELAQANDDADAYLTHAIVMGLAGTRNQKTLAAAVTHPSKAVRLAVLLAYRRLGDSQIARFLQDSDHELVVEAARAINDQPIVAAFPALAAMAETAAAQDPMLGQRALNAHYRVGGPDNAQALARYAALDTAPQSLRLEALRYLSTWPTPDPRDRLIGVYRPLAARDAAPASKALASITGSLFQGSNGPVQAAAIDALSALGVDSIADLLHALVTDETKDGAARVAAFNALQKRQDPRLDDLVTMASQSSASELRLATLPLVAERSPEAAEKTLSLMVQGTFAEQRAAYAALAQTNQPFAPRLLAESLARLAAGQVPFAAQLELLDATENHADHAVQAAYQAYQAAIAADPDPVAPYRFALEGGSSGPGYNVYFNNQLMACIRCHIVNGPGDAAGPNLSDIALKLDAHKILEGIVAPNATIAPGFDNLMLTLADGSFKAGTLVAETDDELTLKTPDGATLVVAKSTIAKRDSMPSSMPAIFGPLLPRKDLRNLVAFLQTQKNDPKARATHAE